MQMNTICESYESDDHNLERTELTFPDGDDGRLYFCTHNGCNTVVPSVTTVTNRREDESKDRAIYYWKRNNDGSDGNANHEHLLKYSGWRGTMFHFQVLSLLDPTLTPTSEEHNALRSVKDHSSDYPWVYSVLSNRAKKRGDTEWFNETFATQSEYDGRINVTLRNAFADDLSWATEAFFDKTVELGLSDVNYFQSSCEDLQEFVSEHVRTSNVVSVEQYIPTDEGYSGQYDIVYEKPSGETVLLDLKNSSGIRWGHECQLSAYANAINRPIDQLCVFRAHSDSQECEMRWEADFSHSRQYYMDEFDALKERVTKLVNDMDMDMDMDMDTAVATAQ